MPPGFEPGPTPFQPMPPGAKPLTFQGFGRAVVQAISVRLADMFARCLHGRAGRIARRGACYDDGVRLVEAHYENGVLRPVERLGLRSGEWVSLMVVRRPDPSRWDLARLSSTSKQEDLTLSEQGLADWANSLDAAERH